MTHSGLLFSRVILAGKPQNFATGNFYCMCRKIPFVTCIMFQQFKFQKLAFQSTFFSLPACFNLAHNFFLDATFHFEVSNITSCHAKQYPSTT